MPSTVTHKEHFLVQYERGLSLRSIAKKYNVSPNTVKKYLLQQNVKVASKNIISSVHTEDDTLLGLYIGLWAGDGSHYYDKGYRVKIHCDGSNKEYMDYVQSLLLTLFNKRSNSQNDIGFRAWIQFNSKFIYYLPYKYLKFGRKKTYTVCLRRALDYYSKEFLEGYFLGLMLSDGYLKKILKFNSTSPKLAQNLKNMLLLFGFTPKMYRIDRIKYNWKDLYCVYLPRGETAQIILFLDNVLNKIGYSKGFRRLKGYGPVEI